MRARSVLVVAVVLAAVVASCGIPVDDAPRAAGSPEPDEATTTTATPSGNTNTFVYLLLDGRLVASGREVRARTPTAVLDALFQPPTDADVAQGLVSAIPTSTKILGTVQRGDVLSVDLSADFEEVIGASRQQAMGQIVMSATGLPGIVELTFSIDGSPIAATSPDRGDVARVQDCDYLPLLATPEELGQADITGEQARQVAIRRLAMQSFCPSVDTSR